MVRTKVAPVRHSSTSDVEHVTTSDRSRVDRRSSSLDQVPSQQSQLNVSFQTRHDSARHDSAREKKKPKSLAQKTGLAIPPRKIWKKLKAGNYAKIIRIGGGIYMAAVIEYLVAEIMELAGNAARDNKRMRIKPRHITLAIRNDEELNKLLGHVTISEGGVLPAIHYALLPKRTPLRLSKSKMDDSIAEAQAPKKAKKSGKKSKSKKDD